MPAVAGRAIVSALVAALLSNSAPDAGPSFFQSQAAHVHQTQFGLPKFTFYVLTVTTNEARMQSIMRLVEEAVDRDWRRFLLFKAVPEFKAFERTPLPTLDLLATPWQRVKGEPLDISKP